MTSSNDLIVGTLGGVAGYLILRAACGEPPHRSATKPALTAADRRSSSCGLLRLLRGREPHA